MPSPAKTATVAVHRSPARLRCLEQQCSTASRNRKSTHGESLLRFRRIDVARPVPDVVYGALILKCLQGGGVLAKPVNASKRSR